MPDPMLFTLVISLILSPIMFWFVFAPGWLPVYALSGVRGLGIWRILNGLLLIFSILLLVASPLTFVVIAPVLVLLALAAPARAQPLKFTILAGLAVAYVTFLGGLIFSANILLLILLLLRGWTPGFAVKDVGWIGVVCVAVLIGHVYLVREEPSVRIFSEEVHVSEEELLDAHEMLSWNLSLHEDREAYPISLYQPDGEPTACFGAAYLNQVIRLRQTRIRLASEFTRDRGEMPWDRSLKYRISEWIKTSMTLHHGIIEQVPSLDFLLDPSAFNVNYIFIHQGRTIGEISLDGAYAEVDWGHVIDCNGNVLTEELNIDDTQYFFSNRESLDTFINLYQLSDGVDSARSLISGADHQVTCKVTESEQESYRLACGSDTE